MLDVLELLAGLEVLDALLDEEELARAEDEEFEDTEEVSEEVPL